jgi:3-phosphoshikimate 1-carboxyvinyltransferase
MNIKISPKPLSGSVRAIPSKSIAHRMLICASFADKPTVLHLSGTSADIEATINCLTTLGAGFSRASEEVTVTQINRGEIPFNPLLDCGESGSTLRFMLPVAAAVCPQTRFTGHGRLPERPNKPLIDAMRAHGAAFSSELLPLSVSHMANGGVFEIAGNVSSQYISGILMAAPLLQDGAEIVFTTEVESLGYINLTLDALFSFGVAAEKTASGYRVAPGSKYKSPGSASVGGDWSNAAFWLVAGALGGGMTVTDISASSRQGDRAVVEILSRMGAEITQTENSVTVLPGAKLAGTEVDCSDIPDLVPVLSVAAAGAEGTTRFYNASRLRLKESDRLETTSAMLRSLGAEVNIIGDELFVTGHRTLSGGCVSSANDHRIAMSAAVASIICSGEVEIENAEAVNKSYPSFFEDFNKLGGASNVIDLR